MAVTGASWNASLPIEAGRNLTADDDDRNRVRHAVAHGRHAIRRARSGRDHDHADAAARARVARGHETGPLLVCRHDQWHRLHAVARVRLVVAEHGVVGWQDRAAAVAENRGYTFVRQHLHDDVGAAHHRACERVRAS